MYTLHPATTEDYRYCYSLCKQSMLPLFTKYWGGWKPEVFRSAFETSNTTIIRIKGRRAGWFSIRDHSTYLYLNDIYISPRYRGRGIGTSIIQNVIESSPHQTLRLTTFVDNPALNLYRRLGFHVDTDDNGVVTMCHTVKSDA